MTEMKPHLAIEPDGPIKFPKYASAKLDGIRCVMVDGKAMTRSLKPIKNDHIRGWLEANVKGDFDGEIVVGPPNLPTTYNTTNSAVMSKKGEPEFVYYVFDIWSSKAPFTERLQHLEAASWTLPVETGSRVEVLKQELVKDQAELDAFYARLIEMGYEGAILKDPDALYKFGRSTAKEQSMLKLKPFVDGEAEILDVYEAQHNTNEAFKNELGQTERSTAKAGLVGNGMVGGFSVKDVATGVPFNCAPGVLTHDERRKIFEGRAGVLGKILKYRSMPYGVKDAPRFPRFVGFRDQTDMGVPA